jgi:phosphopantothenoylcysteine decarboxylase/phosphopantothenate--cysteine ligase
MSKSKILLQLTGSIACYKVCDLLSKLTQAGFEVRVAASESALRFVGAATLEGLCGHPVYSDLWENGKMMDHIHLNRWADLILVAPATANYLNRVAHGAGDDLLGTLFLAHDFTKPFLIVPAMNSSMLDNPVTQKSLQYLQSLGLEVLQPGAGHLACGESGSGRMMEPTQILEHVRQLLVPKENSLSSQKILITAGGTSEPIDDVRVLTNTSTGATAAAMADHLLSKGYPVTFLHAHNSVLPQRKCELVSFSTYNDLKAQLQSCLKQNYFTVIHCAAVSDFSLQKHEGKLASSEDELVLRLHKNPKLVDSIKGWSANKNTQLIAFKLTSSTNDAEALAAVQKLAQSSAADLVVQNDVSKINGIRHEFQLFTQAAKKPMAKAQNKMELGKAIESYLANGLERGQL